MLQDKILEMKGWGSSKDIEGQPKGFCFCINIGEFRCIGDFFPRPFWREYCKKNYFLLQYKSHMFLLEKVWWNVSNLCRGLVECELFRFQLISINCDIVLTQ